MTAGYTIESRGVDKPDLIYVYNWHILNNVDNVGFKSDFEPSHTHKIVAIFKIKYK